MLSKKEILSIFLPAIIIIVGLTIFVSQVEKIEERKARYCQEVAQAQLKGRLKAGDCDACRKVCKCQLKRGGYDKR